MAKSKIIRLMLVGSFGSSLLGLPYVCQFFEVKTAVIQWGILSIFIGLLLLCSTVAWDNLNDKTAKYLLTFEFSFMSIMQLIPIYYWFVANPRVIAANRFSTIISHWAYTVPHFFLFFIGVLVAYKLVNKNMMPNLNSNLD